MTYVPEYMPPETIPGRGGLIAFGVITIIIGALAGCLSMSMPMMFLAMKTQPGNAAQAGMQLGNLIVVFATYVLIAVLFIWVGIGSCRCQRWVRPIILSLAWPWLIFGTVMMVVMTVVMTRVTGTATGQPPPMFLLTGLGFMAIFFVALPLTYVIFYQRKSVRQTLELCDPRVRWTDACPIPVLGLSLWLMLGSVSSLAALQMQLAPFFGAVLTGASAIAVIILSGMLMVIAAWNDYRLKMAGWWLTLLIVLGWFTSSIITFSRVSMADYYRQGNIPPEQIAEMERQGLANTVMTLPMTGTMALIIVGYLFFVRKYFLAPRPTVPPAQTT